MTVHHTATAQVQVLADSFPSRFLHKTKRIRVYTPVNYNQTRRHYPVLYIHDGNNLFDRATSYAGEWRIDETLDSLFQKKDKGIIVVGIDNDNDRISDYSVWKNQQYQLGGNGENYLKFIVEELKPFIDSHFRTKKQPEYTGLGGSSLGGLISFYGLIKYPDVFGKGLIFSPSFWFNPELYEWVRQQPIAKKAKFYVIVGEDEEPDDDVVFKAEYMNKVLFEKGYLSHNISLSKHPDGKHQEWYWSREFAKGYQWLFRK